MVKKIELSSGSENEATTPPKNIKKTKKERSEKQIEAFKKGQEKLKQINAEKKRQKELHLAKVLEEERNKTKPDDAKPIQKVKKPIIVEESDDEPDEEVIIVEKKKKQKKTVKRIIVEETSSESESEPEPEPVRKQKQFKSQQNKKSMIKIGSSSKPENPTRVEFDYTKYFT